MGVDLFFVLSGYLIGGLLFKEWQEQAKLNVKRFLIRRGLKIYPLFYAFLALTCCYRYAYQQPIWDKNLLGELTFTRNFLGGFWAHTWSLCVEEQFYLLMAMLMWYVGKMRPQQPYALSRVGGAVAALTLVSMLLEWANIWAEHRYGTNYWCNEWARKVQTQYCLDSLLYGVWLAYVQRFYAQALVRFYLPYRAAILAVSVAVVCSVSWSHEAYVKPLRDVLLAISFGNIVLLLANNKLSWASSERFLQYPIMRLVGKIGFYSYAIYLLHPFVRDYWIQKNDTLQHSPYAFVVYLLASILLGVLATQVVEQPVLRWRQRYFP